MTAVVTLASYDPKDVKPGWIAFWLIVALGAATYFLWRSMNKQLRKIDVPPRDSAESDAAPPDAGETESDSPRDTA
jgi:hypothetical protein